MAVLYAEFPVKKDSNGDPVYDPSMKDDHNEPMVRRGDTLRWRLVSNTHTPEELKKLQFKIVDVEWDPTAHATDPRVPKDPCPQAHDYPLAGTKGGLDWSTESGKETKLRRNSNGKRVFPKWKQNGGCGCPYHPYKGIATVRKRGSGKPGNVVDPHVRFHDEP